MTGHNRYYRLKGSHPGPTMDAVVVVKSMHRAYTINAYIYLHLYIIHAYI